MTERNAAVWFQDRKKFASWVLLITAREQYSLATDRRRNKAGKVNEKYSHPNSGSEKEP